MYLIRHVKLMMQFCCTPNWPLLSEERVQGGRSGLATDMGSGAAHRRAGRRARGHRRRRGWFRGEATRRLNPLLVSVHISLWMLNKESSVPATHNSHLWPHTAGIAGKLLDSRTMGYNLANIGCLCARPLSSPGSSLPIKPFFSISISHIGAI